MKRKNVGFMLCAILTFLIIVGVNCEANGWKLVSYPCFGAIILILGYVLIFVKKEKKGKTIKKHIKP